LLRDTPSGVSNACHPFPYGKGELFIYLQKKLNVEFPFIHKGVPNLDGEAGYPSGYVRNIRVEVF
jgi:hypothetical protein